MGRNVEQDKINKKERRNEILRGSLLFFARNGYYGSSMSQLAQSLNISQGLIYHYFASKADLLKQIVIETIEKSNATLQILDEAVLDPVSKLKLLTSTMKKLLLETEHGPSTFVLIMTLRGEEEELYYQWSNYPIEVLGRIIADGKARKLFNEIEENALNISYWGLISAISSDLIFHYERAKEYDFELLNKLLIKGDIL